VCGSWSRTWEGLCLRASSEKNSSSWTFMSRESCSSDLGVAIRTPRRTALPPLTSSYRWREGLRCQRCVHSPKSVACECRCKRTWLLKARCNASAASASDTRSETADTHPGALRVGAPTFPLGALPHGNSLSAVAVEETTRRTTVGVLSGRKRGQRLQSRRPSLAERTLP
jgi:hypothetical protein